MRFTRTHAAILLAVALWNVVTFGQFALNLREAYVAGEDRATGYWVAHGVLVVVNYVIAGVLTWLGVRAWRAAPALGR